MGSVGNFLFGGSQDKQSSLQNSQSTNQSQSTSNQNAANVSQSSQVSGNQSQNQAYGPLSASLMSTLGYVPAAGNMMGALLGLPPSTFSYSQPVGIQHPLLPEAPNSNLNNLAQLLHTLTPPTTTPAPTPSPTPGPTTNPVPSPSPYPPPVSIIHPPIPGGGGGIRPWSPLDSTYLEHRAFGGNVNAGQPYIVGENQPEVFVPHTSGTILPKAPQGFRTALPSTQNPATPTPATTAPAPPVNQYSGATPYNPSVGSPTDALNNWANSAGMQFILDQGQKAISGASAGNGTFNSGATGQALEQFGQNLGKTYMNDYMGHLLDYAKLGLGSASALSGAGGTSIGQSAGSSGSLGTSSGTSNSSSYGQSTGYGTSSGNANSKKGLVPDILG